jgi:hypothetical protein
LTGPVYQPEYPSSGQVLTHQSIKSACCLPWLAKLKAGHQVVAGFAWSPFGKIAAVDVSLDGGRSFYPANLTGLNIERAGVRWEFCFHAEPGRFTITPRATDDKGNVQPDVSQQAWNRLGYLYSAAVPHPFIVPRSGGELYVCRENEIAVSEGCC